MSITPVTNVPVTDPAESPIQVYILPRTGSAPLKITGRLVASVSGRNYNAKPDKPNSDWYEISLFQLADTDDVGAVTITYRKDLRGQQVEHHTAAVTDSPTTVLGRYNPLAVLVGFPNEPRFANQQARLEDESRRQYESLVSAALADFPEEVTAADLIDGDDLTLFRSVADRYRARWTFTQAEASLICDACNGPMLMADDVFPYIPAEVEDAIRISQLDKKWNVDKSALIGKLLSMSEFDRAALAISIRDFWTRTDLPNEVALRQAGFLRNETSDR